MLLPSFNFHSLLQAQRSCLIWHQAQKGLTHQRAQRPYMLPFILDYGALILLGLFTFNNLLAKVMSIFFIIFILVVVVFIVSIVNPGFFAGLGLCIF